MICPRYIINANEPDAGVGSGHDPAAHVAALLIKNYWYLYAYLLSAVGNPHDAEDLLQEVSLVAIERADQYASIADFRAWLREIAHNLLLRYAKTVHATYNLLDRIRQSLRDCMKRRMKPDLRGESR